VLLHARGTRLKQRELVGYTSSFATYTILYFIGILYISKYRMREKARTGKTERNTYFTRGTVQE